MNLSRIAAGLALAFLIEPVGCSNPSSQPASTPNPATTQTPQASAPAPANPAATESAAKGSLWKSETTGKEYRVWMEKGEFHAEWTNIPPEFAAKGARISSMGKRQGEKWVGESQEYLPCSVGEGTQSHIANFCRLATGFEIDSISATKITGRGESVRISDCAKCLVSKKEWKDFAWVPKK